MLLVTIVNIDGSFHAIFDHDDQKKAAEALLATLVKDHGFFKDNKIVTTFPPSFTPNAGIYGILAMPGETDDEYDHSHMIDGENTFWVHVGEYKPGDVISDRG